MAALIYLHKCLLELLMPDRTVLVSSAALGKQPRPHHASGASLSGGGCSGDAALRYFLEPAYLTVNYAVANGYEEVRARSLFLYACVCVRGAMLCVLYAALVAAVQVGASRGSTRVPRSLACLN